VSGLAPPPDTGVVRAVRGSVVDFRFQHHAPPVASRATP